jgi:glycosyltransferase involved in cell wall biosynthesis
VEILKIIKKTIPGIRCGIIGEGIEKNGLKKKISEYGLDSNIHLLGFLNEAEKIENLKAAKVFIFPSHEEGWGIVIAEALACGLPTIVYRLHDIVDIWKDNVSWIDCFDLNQFSKKTLEIISDNNKVKYLSNKAKEYSKQLDWIKVLEHEEKIVRKIIN